MPVVGMSGLDGRSARRDAVGSGRKETRPKGGSVHKKKNKIQQRVLGGGFHKGSISEVAKRNSLFAFLPICRCNASCERVMDTI